MLVFADLALLAVITARIDRVFADQGELRAIRLTRGLLWAVATVVVVQAGLGASGHLDKYATFIALSVLAAVLTALTWRRAPPEPEAGVRG